MTASAPVFSTLPLVRSHPRRAWIQSPAYDLSFFVLAPLLTLPVVAGILMGAGALTLLGFLLAFAHYLSTFTFLFWDENRAHHRTRWLAFFGGPVAIALAFLLLVWLKSTLMQLALLAWNTYHVSRQSCGLLSLYRHRVGVKDPRQKALANGAIVLANAWFVTWNIETHREVFPLLAGLGSHAPALLFGALGVLSLLAVARLGLGLRARSAAGTAPQLPELAMIGMSLLLFHPYLWIADSEAATFAMLLPHYVQYLALVWLLHRRKFPQPAGSRAQVVLQKLSSNVPLLLGTLTLLGLAFLGSKVVLARIGHIEVFEAAYLLLAFVHFYLDGLIWAFKEPHVRRSIGTALLTADPLPAAGAA
jgi:hypothetical protein